MSLKAELKPVRRAHYTEKDANLPNGMIIHYAESENNGKQPLLLIHGQTGAWQSYAAVLPALAKKYHVFAVDCHGHGRSSKMPERYSAACIGEDLTWFIRNIIGAAAIVSGHSSGGLISVWLAANSPDIVAAVLPEDPPLFSTEKGERWESSFAYVDTYEPMHRFLNQNEEKDWVVFYLENCAWGKFLPENALTKMIEYGKKYRAKHPNLPLNYWFLPNSLNRMFWFWNEYDLRFGDAFYDSTWFAGFDQEQTLKRIKCPAVLIHTKWSYSDDGVLMAAMSGEDAERANSLITGSELFYIDSGHEAHNEKPAEFLDALEKLSARL